tara:strand:- start:982 stop:1566 length:585 start_codon:yes stop_codon:yes gene_type:complete
MFMAIILFAIVACNAKKDKQEDAHQADPHEHSGHDSHKVAEKPKSGSPRKSAMTNIGDAHIHIDYSSPSVRGRVIWGGLVAYDQVWVTGAHRATSINFPLNVKIENRVIPAGKYALFTIPNKDEWTVIINKNWEQHLADNYSEEEDILRFNIVPEQLNEMIESLDYQIESSQRKFGIISISWEKIKVSFEIEVL